MCHFTLTLHFFKKEQLTLPMKQRFFDLLHGYPDLNRSMYCTARLCICTTVCSHIGEATLIVNSFSSITERAANILKGSV
jgi:hypothetical protein